ncbi:MAG: molecular chaperone TorD family protein [Clostridia bacterium]|nr:molecular chaperone TorD family protein [Clostridia bacterium]
MQDPWHGIDFLPLIQVRNHCYDLLRRTFLEEASPEFLRSLVETDQIRFFPFFDADALIADGAQEAASYLEQFKILPDETVDELRSDYTRLFIGPNKLPAPPWESAYLHEERLLFQKETLMVRRAYLKYHFLPKRYGHEADDHLGLELDFMYQLGLLALGAFQEQRFERYLSILHDQKDFLSHHLLKWVGEFSNDVTAHARTAFYRGMAKILKGFLTLDLAALDELLAVK